MLEGMISDGRHIQIAAVTGVVETFRRPLLHTTPGPHYAEVRGHVHNNIPSLLYHEPSPIWDVIWSQVHDTIQGRASQLQVRRNKPGASPHDKNPCLLTQARRAMY